MSFLAIATAIATRWSRLRLAKVLKGIMYFQERQIPRGGAGARAIARDGVGHRRYPTSMHISHIKLVTHRLLSS
jgi:hypothetical protein